MIRKTLAIIFLCYALFGQGLFDLLDKPWPEPAPNQAILNIEKPSQDVIDRVQIFSSLISDNSDKAKIAIFNYEFASRILNWNTDSQQVNDIYVLAGKKFFNNTLVNKYEGLSENIVNIMQEILGEDNHTLTEEERQKLHIYFTGIAWVLIQKG